MQHETANSHVIVVTAGVRQREGESRRDLLARNVAVFREIVPPLAKLSPHAIFLVVSNPVDVMTYVTWRLSGLPVRQVLGSGTYLDSSRLRVLVAARLGLSPMSVHAQIIGEHGDASVPLWSGANVAGVPIAQVEASFGAKAKEGKPVEPLPWNELHEEVKQCAGKVIKNKGYTNWAIGGWGAGGTGGLGVGFSVCVCLCVSCSWLPGAAVENIVRSIIHDETRVMPLSTNVNGLFGLTEDVFLSTPCVCNSTGLVDTLHVPLSPTENAALQQSIVALKDMHRAVDKILAETATQ